MTETTSASQMAPSGLRPAKRYITSHDPKTGKSTYVDAPEHVWAQVVTFGFVARSYATPSLPARLNNDEDLALFKSVEAVSSHTRARDFGIQQPEPAGVSAAGRCAGVNVNVLDVAPGAIGHWHRTVSFDVSICVMGELDHELESGEKVRLQAG